MRALLFALVGCGGDDAAFRDDAQAPFTYSDPATCGEGVAPGSAPGLVRWPYLQSVTATSAIVAWGGPEGSEAGRLRAGRAGYALSASAFSDVIEGPRAEEADAARLVPKRDTGAPDGPDLGGEEEGDPPGELFRLFHARLEGLEPATEYCYAVEVDGVTLASGLRLRTAPGDPRAPVRFMVIGDFGAGTPEQLAVREQMMAHAEGVDVLFTTGDNAYSSGTWVELHHHVFEVYRELLTRVVIFPTPGNHDYATDEAAPYLANFFLPEDAWREADRERYYTARWGPIDFIAIDSEGPLLETSTDEADDQLDWFEAALAASASAESPWVIPAWHKPVYSGHADREADLFVLGLLLPIIEAWRPPLVLAGHNHFYERFAPLREGERTTFREGGTTWVVTGGGGRSLYELGDEPLREVGVAAHHFLLGEATECALRLRAIDAAGDVIDDLRLDRCN